MNGFSGKSENCLDMFNFVRLFMNRHAKSAAVMACTLGLFNFPLAHAADHIDFHEEALRSEVEPAADISDVFAWVPAPGRLALVMNVHPDAGSGSRFSDKVDYQFRLRRITELADGPAVRVPEETSNQEITIVCQIDDTRVTCSTPKATATARLGDVEANADTALRVFAGLRAEPFYLDVEEATRTIRSGFGPNPTLTMPRQVPKNFSDSLNVLSLVVELDVRSILGSGGPLIAVVGETARR